MMDATEQAAGEKRVKALLIEPLERRGLAKPSKLNKDGYAKMCVGLCQMLAYMSDDSLQALEEQVAANPAGPDRDQIPIAIKITDMARGIQRPPDDASPLIRKVFSDDVGRIAISEGWAPELLDYLRRKRSYPNGYVAANIKGDADGACRRLTIIEERIARGYVPSMDEARFRDDRNAALDNCRRIRQLAQGAA